jgi:hypothetical protein
MRRNWRSILVALAAIVAIGILAGCDTGTGSDSDEQTYEVGDVLSGGFEVVKADPAGGIVAERNFDDDDDDSTPALKQSLVRGRFTQDLTFTSERNWYLDGAVFIGKNQPGSGPVTLTVEAGTKVYGEPGNTNPGLLVIDRGGKIDAVGTADDPIVFTSAADTPARDGDRKPGDWGGIVINGEAPIQGDTAEGEGSTGTYGGDKADDNSGTLKYARVEFGGTLFSPDNQLNGIAFQGVGSGSTFDYIQVHRNADDGIEFFGGSAQVKHVVLTGIEDDSIDHDDGWTGSVQYAIAQQWSGTTADNLLEGDGDPKDVIDPTKGWIVNATLIATDDSDNGLFLRRDADSSFYNTVIAYTDNIGGHAINEDDGDQPALDPNYFGVVIDTDPDSNTNFDTDGTGNAVANVDGDFNNGVYSQGGNPPSSTNFVPKNAISDTGGSPQTFLETDPAGNSLDQDGENFIGAVDPSVSESNAWYNGWIAIPEK